MAEEKLFEGQIKKYFHSVGIYPAGYPTDRMNAPMVGWYTKIWGGGFQKSGIPDIICCVNGVMLAVEVKASNGRPSELQKAKYQPYQQIRRRCSFPLPGRV